MENLTDNIIDFDTSFVPKKRKVRFNKHKFIKKDFKCMASIWSSIKSDPVDDMEKLFKKGQHYC